MQQDRKDKKKEVGSFSFSRMEKLHPYKMLLYLVMIGSAFVFLFLVLAYNISQPYIYSFEYFRIPRTFVVSSIMLLLGSFQISKAPGYYKNDDIKGLEFSYSSSLLLGFLFLLFQFFGWNELISSGVIIAGLPSDSYIHFIFGIHTAHFLIAAGFASYLFYGLVKMPNDPVYPLIHFTNPFEKLKIQLLVQYWFFVNLIWMAVFFYFLFMF